VEARRCIFSVQVRVAKSTSTGTILPCQYSQPHDPHPGNHLRYLRSKSPHNKALLISYYLNIQVVPQSDDRYFLLSIQQDTRPASAAVLPVRFYAKECAQAFPTPERVSPDSNYLYEYLSGMS
jgi:hypothetical protein